MTVRQGSNLITNAKLGYTDVQKICLGDVVVWMRKQRYTDDFERPNGSLGPNWNLITFNSTSVYPVIFANHMRQEASPTNNTNNQSIAIYNKPLATDNMGVRFRLVSVQNGLFGGGLVRGTLDGLNFVYAVLTTNTSNRGICTFINGVSARRSAINTSAIGVGDTFELRVVGNIYQIIRNPDTDNQIIGSWVDSTNIFPTSTARRYCGFYGNSDRNFFGTQNWSPGADDFVAYDV